HTRFSRDWSSDVCSSDLKFPVHSRLPSEAEMARRFGVSRTVIREAVSRLKSEGLVGTRQGSGTSVLEPNIATPFRLDINLKDSRSEERRVGKERREHSWR